MEAMGLEPMTSRVWGERSSQLSYASIQDIIALWNRNANDKQKRRPYKDLRFFMRKKRLELSQD